MAAPAPARCPQWRGLLLPVPRQRQSPRCSRDGPAAPLRLQGGRRHPEHGLGPRGRESARHGRPAVLRRERAEALRDGGGMSSAGGSRGSGKDVLGACPCSDDIAARVLSLKRPPHTNWGLLVIAGRAQTGSGAPRKV